MADGADVDVVEAHYARAFRGELVPAEAELTRRREAAGTSHARIRVRAG